MKAADLKARLQSIEARVAPHLEPVQHAREEEARLIIQHQRSYTIGDRAVVSFSGAPDEHAVIDSMVMLPERLAMLAEVVNHIEQWKAGLIDELVPSGVWPLVGPGYEKSR